MVEPEEPTPATLEEVWTRVDRFLYPKGLRYFAATVWLRDPSDPF